MTLVCQAHSTDGELFDLLWLALFLQQESPTVLAKSNYSIEETKMGDSGGSDIEVNSKLHLHSVATLSRVFCQIQLTNLSLLPPSQAMELDFTPPSPICNLSSPELSSSLVNRTSTCIVHSLSQGSGGDTTSTLYVVVGLIGVFAMVIVALSVVIVLLYRRKYGGKAEEIRPGGGGGKAEEDLLSDGEGGAGTLSVGAGTLSVGGHTGFTNRYT